VELSGRGAKMAGMSPSAFKRSLSSKNPPAGLSPALAALWWAGRDDWDKAHKIVMSEDDADCAWVHAYLHRAEGDLDNAGYWYRQARRKPATGKRDAEWAAIAAALLKTESD
jgi:hypothetical protein